jgi:SDR family mycofactocin-dependent oxidoreductase
MSGLEGKVAFITGAARGQGRSHAVTLAAQGVDSILVDVCANLPTVPYPLATPEDLDETAGLVKDLGCRAVTRIVDVRDRPTLARAFDEGVAELGRIDIVLANAGLLHFGVDGDDELDDEAWEVARGVMLDGVRNTIKVSKQALIDGGRGGSIVITSSTAGLKGLSDGTGGPDGYIAAKHGVIGLMRTYANVLGPHSIRVNTVHPTGVMTGMIMNEAFGAWVAENPEIATRWQNVLPVPALEPVDVSNAIAWLVSDEGRYVTGITLPVDAGFTARI